MEGLTGRALARGSKGNTCEVLEVIRILAHKLSQPLTSMSGSVEVALMGELDEAECRRVLELSLQESHRMAETLEVLRDVLEVEGSMEDIQRVSWTQTVEALLEKAAFDDKNCLPLLVSDVEDAVWVMANPQRLNVATSRLISAAHKAARSRSVVRISLSALGETACLAVCKEGASHHTETLKGFRTPPTAEMPLLGEVDKWIVQRAIERQGGWSKISQGIENCRYQLNLPLAVSEVARNPSLGK